MSPNHRGSSQVGFTLIEMLVVITIIALLIAMLLPAVKKSREKTRQLRCATQQRQIVMAVQGYAIENKHELPWGWWATPSTIGSALDIIEKIQGTSLSETGYDYDHGMPDIALRVMLCPSWKQLAWTDRPLANSGSWQYWGGYGYGPWVHMTYLYVGGDGIGPGEPKGKGGLHASPWWWNGWVTYDVATWNRYDDIYDLGPVPTLGHRIRHSQTGLLTDRMWLTDPSNIDHPYRNNSLVGPPLAVNHRRSNDETDGGNVTFVDGHVEYRHVNQIRERVDVYHLYKPYVCY